jgi:hypothetical protein
MSSPGRRRVMITRPSSRNMIPPPRPGVAARRCRKASAIPAVTALDGKIYVLGGWRRGIRARGTTPSSTIPGTTAGPHCRSSRAGAARSPRLDGKMHCCRSISSTATRDRPPSRSYLTFAEPRTYPAIPPSSVPTDWASRFFVTAKMIIAIDKINTVKRLRITGD